MGEGPGETHALLGSAPDEEVISGPLTPASGAASPGEQELGSRLQAEDVGREALWFLLLFPQRLPRRVPRGWAKTPAHGPGWREGSQRGHPQARALEWCPEDVGNLGSAPSIFSSTLWDTRGLPS